MPASPLRFGLAALLALAAACDAPAPALTASPAPTAKASASVAAPSSSTTTPPAPSASAPRPPEREIAGAQQILVAWKGAERAPKSVTRTKADAKKRADEALSKLKDKGEAFEKVVKDYSDDEASKPAGGAVGNFERNAMPDAFSNATFALEVGATSGVVETPGGFAIIKRTR